jgi:lysophospholipase L1-like esterase
MHGGTVQAVMFLLVVGITSGMGLTNPQAARSAETPFELRGGERLLFFGDSITQSGGFIADVELFLLTRFPDKTFFLLNHGRSSETISGTSEADHHPRRPDAHQRFGRDVVAWKPDLVIACFGMNDGNYHPFEPGRFDRYQEGIKRLIARTRVEAHSRLVLLSPPPFDPYRRAVGDPLAVAFGYKFPAIDYDRTLAAYSDWLLTLASPEGDPAVVNVHGALAEHLKRRREGQVSFYLSGDAVHPGPTGHWLMAQTLLRAWHAPAVVADVRIVAGEQRPRATNGDVSDLELGADGRLSFVWRSPLPLAVDPQWDPKSLMMEQFTERFNQYRLTIAGLPAPQYRMLARIRGEPADIDLGPFSRAKLEQGLDLTSLERFPTVALARAARGRVVKHRQRVDADWRRRVDRDASYTPDGRSPGLGTGRK